MLHLYVNASETIQRFKSDVSGATGCEYVVLTSGVAMAIIVAVFFLGIEVSSMYDGFTTLVTETI